jgi:hypothetical protein
MPRPILIASRDASLRQSRALLLRDAGFTTIRIEDIGLACSMARFEAIGTVVVDSTFTAAEQNALIHSLQQMTSRIHVICVRREVGEGQVLVEECERCERERAAGSVHILQKSATPESQGPSSVPSERSDPRDGSPPLSA